MNRAITLFTLQWRDLPLEKLAPLAKQMGYDGLELACWGDHFDVDQAASSAKYLREKWELLHDNGLTCHAISNHIVGQVVCDLIDERHRAILPPDVWGDGEPEGVRRRAARKLITTAAAARAFFDARPGRDPSEDRPVTVNGFTGSSIWHTIYPFPPVSRDYWEAGYRDFGTRFGPILEAFDNVNVNFGFEVHPAEIAFDILTAQRAVEAVRGHRRFGFNYDASHLGYLGVDYVKFIKTFGSRIFHVHIKDASWGHGDGTVSVLGGHTGFGDLRRFCIERSPGRGDIDFEAVIVALNDIGYQGPLSVEWVEWVDTGTDRVHDATEAAAFVRKLDSPPSGLFSTRRSTG